MKRSITHAVSATTAYTLMQISCWGFYAILLTYSSNLLTDFGFQGSSISILLGTATGLSLLTHLCLTKLLTRKPHIPVWRVIAILGCIILGANLLVQLPGASVAVVAVCLGISCLLLQMFPALVNGIGMDAIRRGSPTNYSIARGAGSLGYSILAYLTGALVSASGTGMITIMGAMCAMLFLVGTVWFHFSAERGLSPVAAPTQEKKQENFFRSYPALTVFLLASILLQFSHALLTNFMFQIMQSKSGSAQEQGIATAISALVELPVMFFFPLLMRRLRCDKWVRLSAIFVSAKVLGLLLAGGPLGVYAAQATQMLGYGLYTISSANYVELVVKQGESIQAQSYLGATCTVGALLALSTGGFFCQHLGVTALLLISGAAALIGGLVIAITAPKTPR